MILSKSCFHLRSVSTTGTFAVHQEPSEELVPLPVFLPKEQHSKCCSKVIGHRSAPLGKNPWSGLVLSVAGPTALNTGDWSNAMQNFILGIF